jgi:flagellar basal body-associated protein FliL
MDAQESGSESPEGWRKGFVSALRSPGLPRVWAGGAILFFIASVGLSGWAVKRIVAASRKGKSEKEECRQLKCSLEALEEQIKKKAELAEIQDAVVSFGNFEIALVGLGNGRKGESGMSLEMDVAIRFDSADTGRWVKANQDSVRGEIFDAVSTLRDLTRADLLEAEGKFAIRDKIQDRVTRAIPSGKIQEIYFSRFLVR